MYYIQQYYVINPFIYVPLAYPSTESNFEQNGNI